MEYLFILLILFKCVVSFEFNKCCPLNHVINNNITECIKQQQEKKWISDINLSIPNYNDTKLNIPCNLTEVMVLNWNITKQSIDKITGTLLTTKNKTFEVQDYCIDESGDGVVVLVCKCNNGICVKHCCEKNKVLFAKNRTPTCIEVDGLEKYDKLPEAAENMQKYFPIYNSIQQCLPVVQRLRHLRVPQDTFQFEILPNGTLYWETMSKNSTVANRLSSTDYCINLMDIKGIIKPNALWCGPNISEDILRGKLYSIIFILGAIFLLATLLVHIFLPELRRAIQGVSLMTHCACMIVAHISFTMVKLPGPHLEYNPSCYFLAYIGQYSTFAAFLWLNVMCIDIALTFRSLRSMAHGKKIKLKFYLLYAFGVPCLISLITYISDTVLDPVEYENIKPNFGVKYCWFDKDKKSVLVFLYGPLGIILIINCTLFIFATYKIMNFTKSPELQQQDSRRHDKKSDKKQFLLFFKLMSLMGVPWIFEIISWAVGGENYYWYFPDALNFFFRPVFIFFMFCCKKHVWHVITKRHPKVSYKITKRIRKRPDLQTQNSNTSDAAIPSTSNSCVELNDRQL